VHKTYCVIRKKDVRIGMHEVKDTSPI